MMRREGGRVVIDISEDEFNSLLIMTGYAIAARRAHEPLPYGWVRLANSINEGNPNFTPYWVPPEPKAPEAPKVLKPSRR
jgi:hypothetical protein